MALPFRAALLCASIALMTPAQAKDAPGQRAAKTVAAMTLDEKIAMVNGHFGTVIKKTRPDEKRIGAGFVSGVPRLGIPDIYETDATLGVSGSTYMRPGDVATALPSGLAMASSFDPDLAERAGAMIGSEARAKGFNVLLAGGANLVRDPWAGRNFEYFSEDVLLTGVMAGANIKGVQSNNIVSTVKHFALNAQESGRYVMDARMDEAALRESDLLAFQIAIERGQPGSVMCGYNKINGDWACENDFLINHVLKGDWGYQGWVMSDWGAVHSTRKAALAGLDQQSGQELDKAPFFDAPLKAEVVAGTVPPARLDDMVTRILTALYTQDLVDKPAPAVPQPIDYAAHGEVAQQAAEAGIVLLKNDANLLPAARTAKRVLVIGGHADIGVLSGGGSSQVRAVSGTPLSLPMPGASKALSFIKITYHGSSPLAAIKARLPGAQVDFLDGSDVAAAAAAAKQADLVLVFAEQWRTEAVDLESLNLSGNQDALIDAVASANPRTVVVLETGGAVLMPWLGKAGAVLSAWYPGDRGGEAIARVLFGEVDASGRLPISFPASAAQAPRPEIPGLAEVKRAAIAEANKPATVGATTIDLAGGVQSFPVDYAEGADAGYRWLERTGQKPLFPFGHGLSYTQFEYADLKIEDGATPKISFTVTNTGPRAGVDVAQVYAAVAGADGKPIKRLVGFQRTALAPGASQTVKVAIDPRLLANFDAAAQKWRVSAGNVPIIVGKDAGDSTLTGVVTLPASSIKP